MTSKEVQDFIYKASGTHIPSHFVDTTKKKWKFLSTFLAWTSPKNEIYINSKLWNSSDQPYRLFTILHELGHIKDPSSWYSSMTERELFAQMWAIKRAKSLGMYSMSVELKKLLGMWEYLYLWNSNHRKYILASRLAKKRKLI